MSSAAEPELNLIVIGGSAGALDVLRDLLRDLPAEMRQPIAVVVHLPPNAPSVLHEVLASYTSRPMRQAEDKERPEAGTVYFAPPGYHLLIERDGCFALSLDEAVHFSRPSIDVLFETAAEAHGPKVAGIILTGASPDGAAGLKAIGEAGGVAIVQAPESAEVAIMPNAAIGAWPACSVLKPEGIAGFLSSLKSRTALGGAHAG